MSLDNLTTGSWLVLAVAIVLGLVVLSDLADRLRPVLQIAQVHEVWLGPHEDGDEQPHVTWCKQDEDEEDRGRAAGLVLAGLAWALALYYLHGGSFPW